MAWCSGVAPRAGAWIETALGKSKRLLGYVAPRAGAWIETKIKNGPRTKVKVAPRAGAWIETLEQFVGRDQSESLPARERGLKHL